MTRVCIQDRAHVLHSVGKQSKRRSLLEGIYNLNRHADKRCYYLHFTDGDQDTLIWCAKGYTQTWGGREGAIQVLKLGYQAALTVTTLPHCTRYKPNSRRVSLRSQMGVHDKQLPLELIQPWFCPHSWFLPSGAMVLFTQEVFVTGWLHKRDFSILSCRCCFNKHLTVVSLL